MSRYSDASFSDDSTMSSLGYATVGMLHWREQFPEQSRQRRSRRNAAPPPRRRRSRAEEEPRRRCCMGGRTIFTIVALTLFLSIVQKKSLQKFVDQLPDVESINFDALMSPLLILRQQQETEVPDIQGFHPLSTYSTLKLYEMSRVKAMVSGDEESEPAVPSGRATALLENNLISLSELAYNEGKAQPVPLFWHIPKAGGTAVHDFAAGCLKLHVASNCGISFGHINDTQLQLMTTPLNRTYVNVDVTSPVGLTRANKLGFKGSSIADIVISPLLIEAIDQLASPQFRAVAFTVMRNPVERSISMFHYLQEAHWEPTFRPEFRNWTLLQYAKRKDMDSDWMVRFLVDKPGNVLQVPLTRDDLETAKRIVREKMWVGFTDNMKESMTRFGQKFGWSKLPAFEKCVQELGRGGSNRNQYSKVGSDTMEWQELSKVHAFDLELYHYARELWTS
jgi:hypothetical protein